MRYFKHALSSVSACDSARIDLEAGAESVSASYIFHLPNILTDFN